MERRNGGIGAHTLETFKTPVERVRFQHFPAYEPWCRDHDPSCGSREGGRRERAVVDWGYNAWANKYPPYDRMTPFPRHIAR